MLPLSEVEDESVPAFSHKNLALVALAWALKDLSKAYLELKRNLITVFNISSYLLTLSSIKKLLFLIINSDY